MNRNECFELHLKERGFRKSGNPDLGLRNGLPAFIVKREIPQVGHWDAYKTGPIDSQFGSWPRECTNVLDNQWTYFQRVFDHGLAGEFPETVFDW